MMITERPERFSNRITFLTVKRFKILKVKMKLPTLKNWECRASSYNSYDLTVIFRY